MTRRRTPRLVRAGVTIVVLGFGSLALVASLSAEERPATVTSAAEELGGGTGAAGSPTMIACSVPAEGRQPRGDLEAPLVEIPSAARVDTAGLVALDVSSAEGTTWVVLVEPAAVAAGTGEQPPTAWLGRIDDPDEGLAALVPLVEGCDVGAVVADPTGVWIATCDPAAELGATAGAEILRVDAGAQRVVARYGVPARCLDSIDVSAEGVIAAQSSLDGEAATVWRLDPASGEVAVVERLDEGANLGGIVADDEGVWTGELAEDEEEAVRTDADTGRELTSAPDADGGGIVLGSVGDALWTREVDPPVLVRRELDSGTPLVEVPVPDLQQAAVGGSGVWFLRATQADLTVTVGRLDPSTGAPAGEFTYVGVGPDRTGLPFLADLVADGGGLWLIEQGTLWRYESGG